MYTESLITGFSMTLVAAKSTSNEPGRVLPIGEVPESATTISHGTPEAAVTISHGSPTAATTISHGSAEAAVTISHGSPESSVEVP